MLVQVQIEKKEAQAMEVLKPEAPELPTRRCTCPGCGPWGRKKRKERNDWAGEVKKSGRNWG